MLTPDQKQWNRQFREAPISGPPEPWRHLTSLHVGGVQAVGFSEREEYLLVISADGRGLFELPSGARVARDYDFGGPWWDIVRLKARALDPIGDEWVTVAGIHGGGLLHVTPDGWSLERIAPDWPNEYVFLFPPGASPFGPSGRAPYSNLGPSPEGESIRVYGFSASGLYFIIATGSEVLLFGRDRDAG
jgi:hypothetical protein